MAVRFMKTAILWSAVLALSAMGYLANRHLKHLVGKLLLQEAGESSLQGPAPLAIEPPASESEGASEMLERVMAKVDEASKKNIRPGEVNPDVIEKMLEEYEATMGAEEWKYDERRLGEKLEILDSISNLPVEGKRVRIKIGDRYVDVDLDALLSDLSSKMAGRPDSFLLGLSNGRIKHYYRKIFNPENDAEMTLGALSDYLARLVIEGPLIPENIFCNFSKLIEPYRAYKVEMSGEEEKTISTAVLTENLKIKRKKISCEDYAVMMFLIFLRDIGVSL
jgi:hypothetical protein